MRYWKSNIRCIKNSNEFQIWEWNEDTQTARWLNSDMSYYTDSDLDPSYFRYYEEVFPVCICVDTQKEAKKCNCSGNQLFWGGCNCGGK